MGSGLCDAGIGIILDAVFLITPMTPPTHMLVGFSTTDPLSDGSGVTRPSGGSYADTICDTWTRTGDTVANTAQINFPDATGDLGDLAWAFAIDSNGVFWGSSPITTPKSVLNGDPYFIPAAGLTISISRT